MNTKPIKVIFRKYRKGGDIIALFPGLPHSWRLCVCYSHLGQHGGADYVGVIQDTVPASPAEYAALKKELESKPFNYRLKVAARASSKDHAERSIVQ